MNKQQIEDFRLQKIKKRAEENAFALASNADAELKEKMEKDEFKVKQSRYSKVLMEEIQKKNELKRVSQLESITNREKEIRMIEEQLTKEKEAKKLYQAKFTDFSDKYDQKNEWYQKHIIQPQMQKHLQDFEREINYNENR